jgi:hypothetical protein
LPAAFEGFGAEVGDVGGDWFGDGPGGEVEEVGGRRSGRVAKWQSGRVGERGGRVRVGGSGRVAKWFSGRVKEGAGGGRELAREDGGEGGVFGDEGVGEGVGRGGGIGEVGLLLAVDLVEFVGEGIDALAAGEVEGEAEAVGA